MIQKFLPFLLLILLLGCGEFAHLSVGAKSGIMEFQIAAIVPIGNVLSVNAIGGNVVAARTDFSTQTALELEEVLEAIYNSTSRSWMFAFQMTYDGNTFVDDSGAVHQGLEMLDERDAIPGTWWVKGTTSDINVGGTQVLARSLKTKGGLTFHFDANSGKLARKNWTSQACPNVIYQHSVDKVEIRQKDCSGLGNWNQLLYTVTLDSQERAISAVNRKGETKLYVYGAGSGQLLGVPSLVGSGPTDGFQYEYDDEGYLTAITNPEGERIEVGYWTDRFGGPEEPKRVRAVTRIGGGNPTHLFDYWAEGFGASRTDYTNPLGEVANYHIENSRRILLELEYVEVGESESWEYDSGSLRPRAHTRANGTTIDYTIVGDDIVEVEQPSGNRITLVYDADANNKAALFQRPVLRIEDNLGLVEAWTYDPSSKLNLTRTNGEGETTAFVWGQGPDFTRLQSIVLPNSVEITFDEYGGLGQATRTSNGVTASVSDFDEVGNPIRGGGGGPEYGGIMGRAFDMDRNPNRITVAATDEFGNITNQDQVEVEYRQSDGQVIEVRRPFGADHLFVYDELGQEIEKWERVDGVLVRIAEYGSDLNGRRTATELANGMKVVLEFDQRNRITSRAAFKDSVLEGEAIFTYMNGELYSLYDSRRGGTEFYSYDSAGRLETTTFPAGETLTREYDVRSRFTAEVFKISGENLVRRIGYDYDNANRQIAVYDSGNLVVRRTISKGQVECIWTENNLERCFTYDAQTGKAVESSTEDLETSEVLERTTLSYESPTSSPAVLQISSSTTLSSAISGTFTAIFGIGPGTEEGVPDSYVGKRILYTYLNGQLSEEFAFDELGNRADAGADAFTHNAERNRLLAVATGGAAIAYSYDDAGFVTERNGIPVGWTASGKLDGFGQLDLEWDALDRFVSLDDGNISRDFSKWGGRIEVDGSGAPLALDLGNTVLDLRTGDRYYRQLDFRGNVQFISNDNAEIIAFNEYGAYGLAVAHGVGTDGVTFVGRAEVADGIQLMGARVYDKHAGIFWAQDPVFNVLNQYSYTLGNPIWFSDSDGNESEFAELAPILVATVGLEASFVSLMAVTMATPAAPAALVAVSVIGVIAGSISLVMAIDSYITAHEVAGIGQGKTVKMGPGWASPRSRGAPSGAKAPGQGNGTAPGVDSLGSTGGIGGIPIGGITGLGGFGPCGLIGIEVVPILLFLAWFSPQTFRSNGRNFSSGLSTVGE